MTNLSRLGLGTVQFGADYGVSNRRGRPSEREVAAILGRAAENGIGYIDTAPAYGDAEALIGRHLPPAHHMRIVTKIPAISAERLEPAHGRYVLDALAASRARMRVDAVYGLLVHQTADLAKPGWKYLVDAMMEAKARGWVMRIGASIYEADHLGLVESRFTPELVQLPFNVLDRRLLTSGAIGRLKAANVEIHARSIFLQGLLLMQPHELPEFFVSLRGRIAALRQRWAERGLSALEGCLAFAIGQTDIDAVVVGINSCSELDKIVAAARRPQVVGLEFLPAVEESFLNPSRWPVFAR